MSALHRIWSAILAALSLDEVHRRRATVNTVAVYFAVQAGRLTRDEGAAMIDGLVPLPGWARRGAVSR